MTRRSITLKLIKGKAKPALPKGNRTEKAPEKAEELNKRKAS